MSIENKLKKARKVGICTLILAVSLMVLILAGVLVYVGKESNSLMVIVVTGAMLILLQVKIMQCLAKYYSKYTYEVMDMILKERR